MTAELEVDGVVIYRYHMRLTHHTIVEPGPSVYRSANEIWVHPDVLHWGTDAQGRGAFTMKHNSDSLKVTGRTFGSAIEWAAGLGENVPHALGGGFFVFSAYASETFASVRFTDSGGHEETDDPLEIVVSRNIVTDEPLTVKVGLDDMTGPGIAKAADLETPLPLTVTIPAGSGDSEPVTLRVKDDNVADGIPFVSSGEQLRLRVLDGDGYTASEGVALGMIHDGTMIWYDDWKRTKGPTHLTGPLETVEQGEMSVEWSNGWTRTRRDLVAYEERSLHGPVVSDTYENDANKDGKDDNDVSFTFGVSSQSSHSFSWSVGASRDPINIELFNYTYQFGTEVMFSRQFGAPAADNQKVAVGVLTATKVFQTRVTRWKHPTAGFFSSRPAADDPAWGSPVDQVLSTPVAAGWVRSVPQMQEVTFQINRRWLDVDDPETNGLHRSEPSFRTGW